MVLIHTIFLLIFRPIKILLIVYHKCDIYKGGRLGGVEMVSEWPVDAEAKL